MSSRSRPTPASSSARWRSRTSTTSRASRRRSRSTRRAPAATRARPSAPSPRSTTTCACSSPAPAGPTARTAAGRSSSRPCSRSSTRSSTCPPGKRIMLLAPVIQDRKGEHQGVLEDARRAGFVRVRVDGDVHDLEDRIDLDRYKNHTIEVVVDRLITEGTATERRATPRRSKRSTATSASRLADSVETALKLGGGVMQVAIDGEEERLYSEHLACAYCGLSFGELAPRNFSFNSPHGACPDCTGLGVKMEIDPELVIPNKNLSIAEGAIVPWTRSAATSAWYFRHARGRRPSKHGFSVRRAGARADAGAARRRPLRRHRARLRALRAAAAATTTAGRRSSRAWSPTWRAATRRPTPTTCARSSSATWRPCPARPARARASSRSRAPSPSATRTSPRRRR